MNLYLVPPFSFVISDCHSFIYTLFKSLLSIYCGPNSILAARVIAVNTLAYNLSPCRI